MNRIANGLKPGGRGLAFLGGVIVLTGFGPVVRADLPSPRLRGNPQYVVPRAVAGVRWESAQRWQLTTPWMAYDNGGGTGGDDGGAAHPNCASTIAFDCFEAKNERLVPARPTDGATNGGYDPDCGVGGDRWFFGEEFCDGRLTANDMTVCPGREGLHSQRVEFAWYWGAEGPGTSEFCLVAIFTAEEFDDTCAGPPFNTVYSGVIYDFSYMSASDGYYYADIANLCFYNLYHQMPLDGQGSYIVALCRDFLDTDGDNQPDTPVLGSCAQPMLWGIKRPASCSQQERMYWQDVANDGELNGPADCVSLDWGLCPDPLGSMVLFYAVPPHLLGDANCDWTLDFFDLEPFVNYLFNGVTPCNLTNVDMDFDGFLTIGDFDLFIDCIIFAGCS